MTDEMRARAERWLERAKEYPFEIWGDIEAKRLARDVIRLSEEVKLLKEHVTGAPLFAQELHDLRKERDGARAAIEDRDKMYEEQRQDLHAKWLRAEAEARQLRVQIGNHDCTPSVLATSAADEAQRLRGVLEFIAAPIRPDGTYNRSREACEQLAREALKGDKCVS